MIYPTKRCRYCKAVFYPTQKTQVFCSEDHQKSYWKHGALPFDKLMARVEKETRRIVREEFAALAAQLQHTETRNDAG